MEYIERIAELKINKLLKNKKIIILLGARQVGKTTLVERLLKSRQGVLLNLDIEVDKARILSASKLTPKDAIKSLNSNNLLIIDEAQRLPEIGQIVKGWYDSKINTKIILLGSSSLNLLDNSAESLTGRNEKVYLPPLLFKETLTTQAWFTSLYKNKNLPDTFMPQVQSLLMEAMVYGSYPEAVTTPDKERYLLNLVSDYLLKDVLQSGIIKSPEIVKKLLMLLAYQIGSEVSISELATNLHTARQTVERYLELLERTFVIFKLDSFSSNQRKEIVKSSKIFFWDTGVRNAILKDFSYSEYRSDIGHLWENFVIAEIAKQNLLKDNRCNLYFWRTKSGSEIDLIIKGTNIFKAFEIKWSKTGIKSRSFTNRYHVPISIITKYSFIKQYDKFYK